MLEWMGEPVEPLSREDEADPVRETPRFWYAGFRGDRLPGGEVGGTEEYGVAIDRH
jgi:hypothetical protein